MKILLITENWPPNVGGIENYLWHIAHQLARSGDEIIVVAPKLKDRYQQEDVDESVTLAHKVTGGLEKEIQGQGSVTVVRKAFYSRLIRPQWWLLYRWLLKEVKKEKVEAVLCGKGLFEGMVGYLIKTHLGVPFGVFTYGMEVEEWRKGWRDKAKLAKVFREAAAIFCINDEIRGRILALGGYDTKVVKAWPGVDEDMLRQVDEQEMLQVLKKYEIRRPYILSVGRLIERKGFDFLIEGYAKLDQTEFGNAQLVIVGDGPMLASLQQAVEDELIDSSVVFLPDVPSTDLPALYSGAALFALTPRNVNGDMEGFGIVYLEAAAQRVPAIGTRTGGVPEAVIDGGTGILVEPDNVRALTKALGRILGDKKFNIRLGEAAKNRVEREFLWSKRIQVIAQAIKDMVKNDQPVADSSSLKKSPIGEILG